MTNESRFLAGVYRIGGGLWLVIGIVLAAAHSWSAFAGWTVGAGLSVGAMRCLEMVVRRCVAPGVTDARRIITRSNLMQLPLITLVISALVLLGGRSAAMMIGFFSGVLVAQAAVVAQTVIGSIPHRSGSQR